MDVLTDNESVLPMQIVVTMYNVRDIINVDIFTFLSVHVLVISQVSQSWGWSKQSNGTRADISIQARAAELAFLTTLQGKSIHGYR